MSVKEYKEYSYVLMKLWIGNLITDGEYNRIMDRVNAVWRQTEGADDEADRCGQADATHKTQTLYFVI